MFILLGGRRERLIGSKSTEKSYYYLMHQMQKPRKADYIYIFFLCPAMHHHSDASKLRRTPVILPSIYIQKGYIHIYSNYTTPVLVTSINTHTSATHLYHNHLYTCSIYFTYTSCFINLIILYTCPKILYHLFVTTITHTEDYILCLLFLHLPYHFTPTLLPTPDILSTVTCLAHMPLPHLSPLITQKRLAGWSFLQRRR